MYEIKELYIPAFFSDYPSMEVLDLPDMEEIDETFTIVIGPSNFDGGDLFYSHIIANGKIRGTVPRFGDDKVILDNSFVGKRLYEMVREIVSSCEKENWEDAAKYYHKFFNWEFDNYNSTIC